ncbi:type II toxin-antitoxin system RatA family toxin [Aliidiomarina haloalkalitolerans]|uniref:Ubiquinone-binding protein n=1 Tax=Aliidiomarina haloalkalitolerans TaxID=859059 RepID=A0A432VZ76_9GAMM|nr:type II toxin-antitoxin system RatA family toxin [Aliidiomarina haloalkalitolerans]RUO21953.1 ubiquinone-binding protein [Aliidiomarina haloalkalitolerans]
MPQIERSALVPYSCRQMYELVNDVAAYPEFVPGCVAARILEESESSMVAELSISKAGIRHAFTTRNTFVNEHAIAMELVQGPFRHLRGGWEFKPLNAEACKVVLRLDFEFSSKMLQFAFGKVFNEVTTRMVDAFAARARQVYGHG